MSALLLIPLFLVSALAPGFCIVRRFRWTPLESLCASIGLSLAIIYLLTFSLYILDLSVQWCYAISAACALLTYHCRADLGRLFAHRSVQRAAALYGGLLLWSLALLSLVRHYSGGAWCGDWFEHYMRCRFFIDRPDRGFIFIATPLPGRPPMMNVLGSFYMVQVGKFFDRFQLIFLLLNLLVCLPLYLIAPALGGLRARAVPRVLPLMLMASPLFTTNVTWTWTKMLAAFYVIVGLWFYVRGWARQDSKRLTAAFVCLSIGFLVHFSAGPYALFLALHYAWKVRPSMHQTLATVALSAAVLSTWFAWSIAVYGWSVTFGSNTTVTDSSHLTAAQNTTKVLSNVVSTLVPYVVRPSAAQFVRTFYQQPSQLGYLRDSTFLLYQTNLLLAMGSVGGVVAVGCFWMLAQRRVPRYGFWSGFVVVSTLVGIAVHGQEDPMGVAHICLQPLVLLGLTLVAANFALLPRLVRHLVVVGAAIDLLLGVLLQFAMEHRVFEFVNGPAGAYLPDQLREGDRFIRLTPDCLSLPAVSNWMWKERGLRPFWGDHFGGHAYPLILLALVLAWLWCWRRLNHGGTRYD